MTSNSRTAIEPDRQIAYICLRLLARREHSRRELLNKLELRGFQQREIDPVLDEMAARNWQDDQRFAASFVRQRIENGYGPLRIQYELRQRGVDGFDARALAEEYAGGWPDLLLNVYRNKYPDTLELSRAEWAKRSRFLFQRGFSQEMI
ncbi:MAG: regulatory protein RecX, partial [Methylomonas sp.]